MNPAKGQFVQIRFNNGTFFDATVEEWSDQKSIVILSDTNDRVIIQKTLQDILLVKIFANKVSPQVKQHQDTEVEQEFTYLKEQPKDESTLKRMAELKDELNKIERQEFSKKVTSHTANGMREISYGLPIGNLQVKSSAQHTSKEITATDIEFSSELSELFS
jgi:hypothetical protein